MCGIAGYFGSRELDPARLDACKGLMRRRGPDSADHRQWARDGSNAYLIHSRLSIIDLDPRSNQPFANGDKHIVFNGELYNYLEVRKELEAEGRTFRTDSDTEVLNVALDHWGPAALERCEGMWAFAVYNETEHSLLLSRDRFGEKPLYIYRDETGLYFGSEVKFITALLGRPLPVNFDHLYRFLVNGYKSIYKGAHSFYQGLEDLRIASVLHVDRNRKESRHVYWKPAFRPEDGMSFEEAVAGTRERLIRSVELRLRADVDLAFCMSGGVDSNALVSIAKNVFDYDVHGFTIANSDARYEEQEMVDASVKALGIRHTNIPVQTDSFLPRLRELVKQHDAPVYTITYYAHWLLMQSIAEHGYRISISGTAADELFTGYYDHHIAYLYEVRNEPELHRASRANWEQHIQPIVRNPFLSDPDRFIRDPGFRDHIFLGCEEFSQYLKSGWSEPFAEEPYADSLLRNRMLNETFHENVPVILHEDDLNAMYYSIENRSPFLDRDLFEFAYRIPSRHLVRDGKAKVVLREAIRGIAPDAIVDNRRKVGFNAPVFDFLDVNDPAVSAEVLADSPIFDHIKREPIEQLLQRASLPNSESKFLFYFLTAKLFLEECAG